MKVRKSVPNFRNVCIHCGDTSGKCDCNLPCLCGNIKAKCVCDKLKEGQKREQALREWALSRAEWI